MLTEDQVGLTGTRVVDMVITDLGVFDTNGTGFDLVELAPEVSLDDVRAKTDAPIVETVASAG